MITLLYVRNGAAPAVRFYRGLGPLSWLCKELGGQMQIREADATRGPLNYEAFYGVDIVFVEHAVNEQARATIANAKKWGLRVWIDHDDNLLDVPRSNTAHDYFASPSSIDHVQRCAEMADVITVTTPRLFNVYRPMCENVKIIPNAWMDYQFGLIPLKPTNTPPVIGWRGGHGHGADLLSVRDALQSAIDRGLPFQPWGYDPHFLQYDISGYRKFNRDLGEFYYQFFTNAPDFLVVPLLENEFNHAKSNLSWIEATMAGTATIAPEYLKEFKQPGVVHYKNPDHLKDILHGIAAGEYDKAQHVEKSREALKELRLSKINVQRKNIIEKLLGLNKKQNQKMKVVK